MNVDFDDWPEPDYDDILAARAPDPKVEEASARFLQFFEDEREEVFYEMQLEVIFESEYFHWITTKALAQLRDSGKIGSALNELSDVGKIRFYFHRKNRYWRRKAAEIGKLVRLFSQPNFKSALGNQGELLVDAGVARIGFMERARNTNSFRGIQWAASDHNLDRILEKEGVHYGVEIKNRLSYISHEEFQTKIRICEMLNLRPVFVVRMMPKSYTYELFRLGGFALIMKHQFYPLSQESFALQVRTRLRLPVDCPPRLTDGTLNRLLLYHDRIKA